MNIVVISDYASRELYVIEQIIKNYPATVVVRPDYSNQQNGQHSKKGLVKRVSGIANAITWKLHREIWNYKLYPGKDFPDIPNLRFVPAQMFDQEEGAAFISSLKPDVLITCRAPLLKASIIKIPKVAAVNVHYGLAPHYRGNHTLFWPLYYKDYDRLGGCLHLLTEGIDTGNIIAEVYPDLKPNDGEIAVDIKTTKLLSQALIQFLQHIEKGETEISGKPQNLKGRNFNSKDRHIGKSLSYLARRALGMSKPPKRPEKIITYF